MSSHTTTHTNEHKKKANTRSISPAIFVSSLLIVLGIGVGVGMYHRNIYATVAPMIGAKVSTDTIDTEPLQRAYQELRANFDGELSDEALIQGAVRGMIDAAGDEYTVFMSAEEAKQFNQDMSGSIGGGVGAQVGVRDNIVTLVKIITGTPAERAGLKAGDRVMAINGESAEGLTVDAAVSKIRGDIGTTVKLTIKRGNETKEFTITREAITAPSVESKIDGGVGVITVTRFDQSAPGLVRKAAQQFKESKVRGVVLDLRGNPGGYLSASKEIAGVWLDKKIVVTEKEGDRVIEELRSGSQPVLEGVPTVVLIDSGSASASEIVAGALQDHKAATLLGETTYGKGSVQRLLPLSGGAMLKVTIAKWYTPSGRNITKEGIAPDVEVKVTAEQLRNGDDVQMKAALKRLR